MNLVIIESPFAGEVERNLIYARRALSDCLTRGEAPIASHLLLTQVLDDTVPEQREMGIEAGLAWLPKADFQVFYIDYGKSRGMVAAAERGRMLGIKPLYRRIGRNP